ncbi:hypothetical protein BUALT_Bualt16G0031700 [Buddleja alternifolia]|uniref:Reverse transcriptase RNase H-like domain-containing protein n=1 Tax=Buddleja alternifolia TaxID=168488 RepID=A0AAV6W6C0_9LAMI|nr:hypothetical protein BUALT_Bualt16G0031700 [Buddleja alternifolia]
MATVIANQNQQAAVYGAGTSGDNGDNSHRVRGMATTLPAIKFQPRGEGLIWWGRHFTIKIDHKSLKHLMKQRISTPSQEKWLVKLLGYDFTIQYKSGQENIVVDALSRQAPAQVQTLWSISSVQLELLQNVKDSYTQDANV